MRADQRRRSAQDRCRALFVVAALGGTLGIVAGISISLPTALVASWCAMVVAGYGLVMLLIGAGQIGPRQAGDAINSLGFILALALLTITVWMFAAWRSDVAVIVRSFAAALASIGCGFGLKVLIQLFREEADEIEDRVRLALIEVSRELHVQVVAVLQDLGSLRVVLAAEIAQAPATLAPPPSEGHQEAAASVQTCMELVNELRLLRQALADKPSAVRTHAGEGPSPGDR